MKTYEPMGGENISKTAKRMVALAKKTRRAVKAKFNDIALTAKPGDNPNAIVQYYQAKVRRSFGIDPITAHSKAKTRR